MALWHNQISWRHSLLCESWSAMSVVTIAASIGITLMAAAVVLPGIESSLISNSSSRSCVGFGSDGEYGKHFSIVANGIRLHYVENGDKSKPLMIFLHSFAGLWWNWRSQLEYFAKSHWVVALDMRGYGDSQKLPRISDYSYETLQEDIVELVRGLGRNSTILVGHEWGGLISWGVAANYPEVVSKLIILNSAHPNLWLRPSKHSSIFQWLKSWYVIPFSIPYLGEAGLAASSRLAFPALLRAPGFRLIVPPLTAEELAAFKCAFPRRGSWTPALNYYRSYLMRLLRGLSAGSIKDLPRIHVPTLIIWGDKEFYMDSATPELCKPFVDELTIQHLPEAGAFLVLTHQIQVSEAIESFVRDK